MVLSPGLASCLFELISTKLEPQFVQVSLKPNDIAPQLLHVFTLVLRELKPINNNSNNNMGIRNKINKILPRKLIKKLIPNIGIVIKKIKE
tara:strand:- start:368 stop:640 length:273 start_codon:yes stop_codon:yes gene_type:complete